MKVRSIDTGHLTPAGRWAVRACFCLLAITLVVQALHIHPNELAQTDVKHCAICQVAHAPIQIASIPRITYGLSPAAFVVVAADAVPKAALASFSLFSRPPPPVA